MGGVCSPRVPPSLGSLSAGAKEIEPTCRVLGLLFWAAYMNEAAFLRRDIPRRVSVYPGVEGGMAVGKRATGLGSELVRVGAVRQDWAIRILEGNDRNYLILNVPSGP